MVSKDTYIAVLAGMGGFSDGFALLLGGAALLSLSQYFKLTPSVEGLIISAPFIGSVIGSLIFGRLSDLFGRRAIFLNVLLFFVLGSLVSALAYSIPLLVAGRLLVGIGIGGDIPSGASLVAELSSERSRGRLISVQSILWGLGGALAALVALPLLGLMGSESWRIILGLGAVPPLIVLLLRRSVNESWVWELKRRNSAFRLRDRGRYTLTLAFTAASLFVWTFILAIFANYTPTILVDAMKLSKSMALLIGGLQWIGFVAGGLLVFKYCDRLGRRRLIIPATVGEAVLLGLSALVVKDPIAMSIMLFILWVLGGIGYIVNSIYSAELFPTLLRGTSSGLGFSAGRLGGYLSTLIIPSLLLAIGLSNIFLITVFLISPLAMVCLIAAPSSENKSLDELEGQYY
ncbi:MFS transporter [Caldivirga sp.]|uniref:MFS transporter n=1 Tax=Caldivirga sp. TaxID=2080243 RepID=UPI003D0D0FD4